METYQKHIIILLFIYLDIGIGILLDFDIIWFLLIQALWCFVILAFAIKEPKKSSHAGFIPLDFYSDGGTGTM